MIRFLSLMESHFVFIHKPHFLFIYIMKTVEVSVMEAALLGSETSDTTVISVEPVPGHIGTYWLPWVSWWTCASLWTRRACVWGRASSVVCSSPGTWSATGSSSPAADGGLYKHLRKKWTRQQDSTHQRCISTNVCFKTTMTSVQTH